MSRNIGTKKVTGVTPLGEPPLGYEIHFEDTGTPIGAGGPPNYTLLKESIEEALPTVQVNTTRCHEGVISFVMIGITSEAEREKVAAAVQRKVTEALENGYGYASLADRCAAFCHEANPRIIVKEDTRDNNVIVVVQYWPTDLNLDRETLALKTDQIGIAAKGAFFCQPDTCFAPSQISIMKGANDQVQGGYCVMDAVSEIVDLLKASCVENPHYDPDYAKRMMV